MDNSYKNEKYYIRIVCVYMHIAHRLMRFQTFLMENYDVYKVSWVFPASMSYDIINMIWYDGISLFRYSNQSFWVDIVTNHYNNGNKNTHNILQLTKKTLITLLCSIFKDSHSNRRAVVSTLYTCCNKKIYTNECLRRLRRLCVNGILQH